jgi:hypothetical protein
MIEPFFAPGPPIWASLPQTVPAWPQMHQVPGLLQTLSSLNTVAPDPSAPMMGSPRRTYGLGGTSQGPAGISGGLPSLSPTPELSGVSPSMLLGTIALRRGQLQGPGNDQEIEDFMYDALDMFWGTNDVEVRSEQGRVALTGTVQQKRLKRDIGEIAWAIAAVADVQNNVTITARRRSRGMGRDSAEASPTAAARKQS